MYHQTQLFDSLHTAGESMASREKRGDERVQLDMVNLTRKAADQG